MAEPTRNKRISLGIVVLLYLGVLFVFAYWLKRNVLEGRALTPASHGAASHGSSTGAAPCSLLLIAPAIARAPMRRPRGPTPQGDTKP